jgi:hypothetical protein
MSAGLVRASARSFASCGEPELEVTSSTRAVVQPYVSVFIDGRTLLPRRLATLADSDDRSFHRSWRLSVAEGLRRRPAAASSVSVELGGRASSEEVPGRRLAGDLRRE